MQAFLSLLNIIKAYKPGDPHWTTKLPVGRCHGAGGPPVIALVVTPPLVYSGSSVSKLALPSSGCDVAS